MTIPRQDVETQATLVARGNAMRPRATSKPGGLLYVLLCALCTLSIAQAVGPTANAQATHAECNGWGGKPLARTELFFGLARPNGSTVSAEEFQRFVDREVTPRFPAGLTLLGGNGQFRDASGTTIKENAKLLILLYPYDRSNSGKIESIRMAYTKAFQQESVLRVDGNSCVS